MAEGEIPQAQELEQLLASADPEFGYRRLAGPYALVAAAVAVGMSLFHLYTAGFGTLLALKQRAVHLGFVFTLVFLLYPLRRRHAGQTLFGWADVAFALAGLFSVGYLLWHHDRLMLQAGQLTRTDLLVGVAGLLLVLEAGRRVMGVLPFIAAALLVYPFVGEHLPGLFAVRRFPVERVIEHMWYTTEGVFGIPLGVSATYVFLFVLLGAFLERTGLGQLFVEVALALAGWMHGGPAKVSVFSSALLGTVSGSSVANVVADGVFNIPLMKRLGYHPRFAAAAEAATSVGGQIMPPVMGAAAFVMAEFLGVPYLTIVQAAVVPALLYFVSLFFVIHFEARRLDLRGLRREELPDLRRTVLRKWYLVVPLLVMVLYLVRGFSPARAAFMAIALAAAVHLVTCALEGRLREYPRDLWGMLEYGARNALTVALACAVVGIIIGVVTLTGIGNAIVTVTTTLGQHNLFLTLALVMVACTIIGSGIPTTATYIILAALAVPAIEALLPAKGPEIAPGVTVSQIAGHLFIFYYGVIADLTPPDALAAYAAAGIARTAPFPVSLEATRHALAAILVPFAFVYSPELLLLSGSWADRVVAVVSALAGIVFLSAAVAGYFFGPAHPAERVLLAASAVAMVVHQPWLDAAGLVAAALVAAAQLARRRGAGLRRERSLAAPRPRP